MKMSDFYRSVLERVESWPSVDAELVMRISRQLELFNAGQVLDPALSADMAKRLDIKLKDDEQWKQFAEYTGSA